MEGQKSRILGCFGEGNGNPLQYSCLENPWTEEPGGLLFMGSHRVRHDGSDLACMHAYIGEGNGNPLQCSSWRIPGTEEPGGVLSMGSHRVRHD